MKRFCVFLALILTTACSASSPDAGYEGVLIKKPMFFGSGGVAKEPVQPGLVWVAFTTSTIYVDMRPQEKRVEFDDLFTSNGVPLDFDSAVRYKVNDSVNLINKFGEGWFETNLERPFRDAMRDAVKRRDMLSVAFDTQTSDEIDAEVTQAVSSIIKEAGIPVTLIDITLGRANPPDDIKAERTATAAEALKQNTQRERKITEDLRKDAENSRALADKAYNQQLGITLEQYIAIEQIKAFREICGVGKSSCTFVSDKVSSLVGVR